jgi:hypothetical protein
LEEAVTEGPKNCKRPPQLRIHCLKCINLRR